MNLFSGFRGGEPGQERVCANAGGALSEGKTLPRNRETDG